MPAKPRRTSTKQQPSVKQPSAKPATTVTPPARRRTSVARRPVRTTVRALPCPLSDTTAPRTDGDALDLEIDNICGERQTGRAECPWCQTLARAPRTSGSLTRICMLHARQLAFQGAYDAAHAERPGALVLLAYGTREHAYTVLAEDALDLYMVLAMALDADLVPPLDMESYHEWTTGDPIPALHLSWRQATLARTTAERAGRVLWQRTVRCYGTSHAA